MSRAAILPFPGDPFLLTYWLKFYNEFWRDEIDKLYIVFNSPIEEPVREYIRGLCRQDLKIKLIEYQEQIDHGPCIDSALERIEQDLVMLIEDDGFIFKSGLVDDCFRRIELGEFDIVGSKRGSCSMEILTAAKNKWGLDYEGEGDHGPNFWPNFLFLRTDLLKSTDRNFSAKQWKRGEVIKGLDWTVDVEAVLGDTLVNTSLQLRGLVPIEKIHCVPQYHGSPQDLEHFEWGKYLFDGRAGWTHVGSLSSGVGGVLMDDFGRSLARRTKDLPKSESRLGNYCNSEGERSEWERRVQWWLKFVEYFNELPFAQKSLAMVEFAKDYEKAIARIIEQYQLNIGQIRKRQRAYATLGL